MTVFDDLVAAVTKEDTLIDGMLVYNSGLVGQLVTVKASLDTTVAALDAANVNVTALTASIAGLQAIIDQINTKSQVIADALVANVA